MKDKGLFVIGLIFIIILIQIIFGLMIVKEIRISDNCLNYSNEDVNKDGKVDIKDLLIVQKKIISQKESEDR